MDFLKKLDFLMDRYELTKTSLSQKSGIPYTTIDAWYKKGYEGLKLTTLRKLAGYFNTTLDYWFLNEITDPNYGKTSGFKVEYDEMEHIKKYRLISDKDANGKKLVDSTITYLFDNIQQDQKNDLLQKNKPNKLHLYTYLRNIACAGTGFYFDDIPTDVIEVPYMQDTDFIIGVNGNSMEPDFHDGELLYVQKVHELALGDTGIFTVGNECFVKQLRGKGLISKNTEDVRLVGRVLGKVEEL